MVQFYINRRGRKNTPCFVGDCHRSKTAAVQLHGLRPRTRPYHLALTKTCNHEWTGCIVAGVGNHMGDYIMLIEDGGKGDAAANPFPITICLPITGIRRFSY